MKTTRFTKIYAKYTRKAMNENEISKIIFDMGLKVHKILGPGLLESAYEECMYYELTRTGLYIEKQKPMPLIYD
jgi:GxxExxY protein